MRFRLEYDEVNRVLCTILEGAFSLEDCPPVVAETRKHIDLMNPAAGVLDLSELDEFQTTAAQVRQAVLVPPIYPPGVVVVVVAPADIVYGFMRMLQMLSAHTRPHLHVVRTHAEACQVLGIARADLKPIHSLQECPVRQVTRPAVGR